MSSLNEIIDLLNNNETIESLDLAFELCDEEQLLKTFEQIDFPQKTENRNHLIYLSLEKNYFLLSKKLLDTFNEDKFQRRLFLTLLTHDINSTAFSFFLKNVSHKDNLDAQVLNSCFLTPSQVNSQENAINLLKYGCDPFKENKNRYTAFALAFMHFKHVKTFQYMMSLIETTPKWQEQFLNIYENFKQSFHQKQSGTQINNAVSHILNNDAKTSFTPQQEKILIADALYQKLFLIVNHANQKQKKSNKL